MRKCQDIGEMGGLVGVDVRNEVGHQQTNWDAPTQAIREMA
jgi:hypothetical protein